MLTRFAPHPTIVTVVFVATARFELGIVPIATASLKEKAPMILKIAMSLFKVWG